MSVEFNATVMQKRSFPLVVNHTAMSAKIITILTFLPNQSESVFLYCPANGGNSFAIAAKGQNITKRQ